MKYSFDVIGHIRCSAQYPQEAPRQGILTEKTGTVVLEKQRNFETALSDLEGMERIWIVFVFDRVTGWKPKVRPPLGGSSRKIGVFATRSPHRPNPIGLTCARLLAVRGLELDVAEIDLLDGTPVLDIKPYIPQADAFPQAKTGWRDRVENSFLPVVFKEEASGKADFLLSEGGPDLREFCRVQLGTRDIDPRRLRLTGPDGQGLFTLAFRTWRMICSFEKDAAEIRDITSGYSQQELLPGRDDPYGDKSLHRLFNSRFETK